MMNYLENLKVLAAAIEARPELDLSFWANERSCGTIYCAAGLAATLPYFRDMGMSASESGAPYTDEPARGLYETLNHFFGTYHGRGDDHEVFPHAAMDVLFRGYFGGEWDDEIMAKYDDHMPSDRQLALDRLALAIAYHELIQQGPEALRAAGYGRVADELEVQHALP
jgi:hypothetical protein